MTIATTIAMTTATSITTMMVTTTTVAFPPFLMIGQGEGGRWMTVTTTMNAVEANYQLRFSKDEQETNVNLRGKKGM